MTPHVAKSSILLLGVLFGLSSSLLGQDRSLMQVYGDDEAAAGQAETRALEENRRQAEQRYAAALYAPLEGAIDPATYVVGPNDQFTVSVGGIEPRITPVLVSADGGIVIPGIGRVEAAGKTLEQVQADVRSLLSSSFRNVESDIALARPREFWVHVTGAVPAPGRYLSRPVGRLEDVLSEAFLLDSAPADLDPVFRPALRNVRIRHADGVEQSFDLVQYYRSGNISQNPYLRDGDAITVPSYDRVRSSIFISGDVPFPGDYDFRTGDTMADLIAIGAGNLELDPDRVVRLTRRAADGSIVNENYTFAEIASGARNPALQPLDQVNVPMVEQIVGVAAVEGAVQFPGQYPIEIGVTTLTDLVGMTGGFREDALVRGAYLQRGAAFGAEPPFPSPTVPPTGGRFEVITDSSAALWQMRLADFDYMSRQFLARWMRMDQRVSVDVLAATRSGAPPVYLRDGDRLIVPTDENSVYVIGEVFRPGRTPVVEGYGIEDYVAAAGGRGPRASGTYVIRAGLGQVLDSNAPVFSGDYVFVDRSGGEPSSIESERIRLMREESRARNRQVWLQAVTAGAAVITTTVLVIRELEN